MDTTTLLGQQAHAHDNIWDTSNAPTISTLQAMTQDSFINILHTYAQTQALNVHMTTHMAHGSHL